MQEVNTGKRVAFKNQEVFNADNNQNYILSQNINSFQVKKFEEEFIKQYFEKLENNKNHTFDQSLLILFQRFKLRRLVMKSNTGLIKEFKAEEINLKKSSLMKVSYSDQSSNVNENSLIAKYKNVIVKITNVPFIKVIEPKYFDLKMVSSAFNVANNGQNNINNDKINFPDGPNDNNKNLINLNQHQNVEAIFNCCEVKFDKDISMPDAKEKENINLTNNRNLKCGIAGKIEINNNEFSNDGLIDCVVVLDANENFVNLLNAHSSDFCLEKEINICCCACIIQKLETKNENEFTKYLAEKEAIYNAEEIMLLKKIKNNIDNNYSMFFSDNFHNETFFMQGQDEKDQLKKAISEDLQNINKISFYIESKELWDIIEVNNGKQSFFFSFFYLYH